MLGTVSAPGDAQLGARAPPRGRGSEGRQRAVAVRARRSALGDRERTAHRPHLARRATSSPTTAQPSTASWVGICPPATSSGDRDGRSKPGPILRRSAGARFTVMRRSGNSKPGFTSAARTRSRASRTALSASPTTVNAGRPWRMSASTHTRRLVDAVHGEGGDPGDHGSERALEVVQPDELVVTVHGTPTASKRRRRATGSRWGSSSQAAAIRRTWDCLATCWLSNGSPEPEPAGLDLAERDSPAVGEHEVQLAPAGVVVLREHVVAESREVLRGEALAEPSEVLRSSAAMDRHARSAARTDQHGWRS